MIRVNEDNKTQIWYEETEDGFQVCIRKPHNDYFRTEYIKCDTKQIAVDLVKTIKENGYTNISDGKEQQVKSEIMTSTSRVFSFGNDDFINKQDKPLEAEPKEEKKKAKFEFGDEYDLEHQYNKIPRYDEIPEGRIRYTGEK